MHKVISRQAVIDLEEIFVFISDRSTIAIADRVIDAIVDTCKLLSDYPEMGRRRPEYDSLGFEVRSLSEGSYLILYTIRSGLPLVARVFHGAQDISALQIFPLPGLN